MRTQVITGRPLSRFGRRIRPLLSFLGTEIIHLKGIILVFTAGHIGNKSFPFHRVKPFIGILIIFTTEVSGFQETLFLFRQLTVVDIWFLFPIRSVHLVFKTQFIFIVKKKNKIRAIKGGFEDGYVF